MKITDLTEESKSTYSELCLPVDKTVQLENVILSPENKKKIDDFLVEHENRKKLTSIGLKPMNKIIMYGASGTGKTYLTQALANHFSIPMLRIAISQLKPESLPETLNRIFKLAAELGEALIFLDECDAICWARDDEENDNKEAIRRANNALFLLLDNLSPNCIFVSATNLFDKLDVAFKRRFNLEMKFLAPKIDDFGKAVKKFVNKAFTYVEDMDPDIKKIVNNQAMHYARMSYYQIEDWVHKVEKEAIISNNPEIKESDIYHLLMQAMRIEVKRDTEGNLYLHQYGVQSK